MVPHGGLMVVSWCLSEGDPLPVPSSLTVKDDVRQTRSSFSGPYYISEWGLSRRPLTQNTSSPSRSHRAEASPLSFRFYK